MTINTFHTGTNREIKVTYGDDSILIEFDETVKPKWKWEHWEPVYNDIINSPYCCSNCKKYGKAIEKQTSQDGTTSCKYCRKTKKESEIATKKALENLNNPQKPVGLTQLIDFENIL